jgi:NIMA (never in mitosis gene a)-related kinase
MRDFDVILRLGAGSFGTVYKVKRKADNFIYVLKSVRIAELPYQEQIDAINEVRLLAQMDCPYIVRYFDSFIEEDIPYCYGILQSW